MDATDRAEMRVAATAALDLFDRVRVDPQAVVEILDGLDALERLAENLTDQLASEREVSRLTREDCARAESWLRDVIDEFNDGRPLRECVEDCIDTLRRNLAEERASDKESCEMYHRARDRADVMQERAESAGRALAEMARERDAAWCAGRDWIADEIKRTSFAERFMVAQWIRSLTPPRPETKENQP